MVDVVESVVSMVRNRGISVEGAVSFRSTNNVVVWLSPSPVVAKIAADVGRDLDIELSWAHALAKIGAPVVARHRRSGRSFIASASGT